MLNITVIWFGIILQVHYCKSISKVSPKNIIVVHQIVI